MRWNRLFATLITTFLALPTLAQECNPASFATAKACTIQEIITHFSQTFVREATEANDQVVEQSADTMEEEVKDSNRATTAPESFAARLHNSYEDFLNPLAFAINKIEESEDGQALTVRFNPWRSPGFEAGLTATIAKPTLLSEVQNNIAEANRVDMTKKIEDDLGDFEDVTLAASYSIFSTEECKLSTVGRCWGRNPKSYRNLLSEAFTTGTLREALFATADTSAEFRAENAILLPDFDKKLSELDDAVEQQKYDLAKRVGTLSGMDNVKALQVLSEAGMGNLATLIDNQPQLAGTLTYHHREDFTGPPEFSATVELQWGPRNINSLKKGSPSEFGTRLAAGLRDPKFSMTENSKIVLSLSYKRVDPYKLDTLGDFAADDVPFTGVDIKGNDEFKLKAQYGWELSTRVTGERPRIDFSTDFTRRNEGGERKLNRLVGTATFTVPYGNHMSIPISLKYANRPEDLQEERKRLSIHFGLSYRLPWEMK